MPPEGHPHQSTRRQALQTFTGAAIAGAAINGLAPALTQSQAATAAEQNTAFRSGRLKQSIVHWCFAGRGEKWSITKTCEVARELGYASVELVGPEDWPIVKQHGLTCAIVGAAISPGPAFMRGFNNPRFQPMVIEATKKAIEGAAANGFPNVICFTGFSAHDPDEPQGAHFTREEGAAHCVAGLKQVIGHAEKHGVTLCLEMLNSRDDSDPMKGHPGYQGDHTDYCIEIIKAVGSPRMKLLFDVYHVQIMDGDVIRRIRQYHEWIGHVHTAGNPGRGELDANQEIQYPAVMRALREVGYEGYVGQEFIPTRDPLAGLREAFTMCDV